MKSIDELVDVLNSKNINFDILIEPDSGENIADICDWPLRTFPDTGWGNIDWNKVENKNQLDDFDISEAKDFFKLNFMLDDNEIVYLEWSNALRPTVSISYNDCLKIFETIIDLDMDCWIYSIEHSTVMESYHEGVVTIGKAE